jgi:hypothetical protein
VYGLGVSYRIGIVVGVVVRTRIRVGIGDKVRILCDFKFVK